ncbi:hypothetical protein [Spirosoma panaciterrae]|uniref:hypothetical protein n=1 Tax=Spirosoma panaciterrae TaxID=496058 RepID=UPI0003758891|nr:hypothetical protein [Spirosoma panaciterrae]
MTFLVNLYTQDQQERTFSFSGVSLDSGLDIINALAKKGDTLQRVRYLDEDGISELPVYLFDGAPFAQSLANLEQDWRQLLTQPNGFCYDSDWMNLFQRARHIRQSRIAHLQACHDQMQQLIWKTQHQMKRGAPKTRLLRHYQQALNHFRTSLARTNDYPSVNIRV